MSALKAAAQDALKQAEAKRREEGHRKLEAELTEILEDRWEHEYRGFGLLVKDGFPLPKKPARSEFKRVPYPGIREFTSAHNSTTVHGWRVTVDDVDFLFSTAYNKESLYLIHTCPACGAEGASTFYGLKDIAELLEKGPKFGHRCLEAEAREVAYAIGRVARDTGRSPNEVVDLAHERHGDLISSLRYGR